MNKILIIIGICLCIISVVGQVEAKNKVSKKSTKGYTGTGIGGGIGGQVVETREVFKDEDNKTIIVKPGDEVVVRIGGIGGGGSTTASGGLTYEWRAGQQLTIKAERSICERRMEAAMRAMEEIFDADMKHREGPYSDKDFMTWSMYREVKRNCWEKKP
jgi:hypothetical protein